MDDERNGEASKDTTTQCSGQDFLTGKLLIAMPNMGDPRFDRSVVLVCTHAEDHAMGVIVNKPIDDVSMSDLLEQLDIEMGDDVAARKVFFGGPVQTERGLILHTLDYKSKDTVCIGSDFGITASKDILLDITAGDTKAIPPSKFFLAIGHAGWIGGQLEKEIAMNAWAHCDADNDIIFSGQNDATWRKALKRLGVSAAMLSPEWATVRDDDTPLN